MPGFTPNFGIQYPCAGEVIDPAVFQAFADSVETALDDVDTLSASALQRPRAAIVCEAMAPVAGAVTNIPFNVTEFNSGLTVTANGYDTIQGGFYVLSLDIWGNETGVTTVSSIAAQILVGGQVRYRRKVSLNPAHIIPTPVNVFGCILEGPLAAITHQMVWTGAGPVLDMQARATIMRIAL